MITIIKKNENFYVDDQLLKIVDDGRTVVLPPNDMNRKYQNIAQMDKSGYPFVIDTYKETRTLNRDTTKTNSSTPSTYIKIDLDLLNDDEKLILKELKEKIERRAEIKRLEAEQQRILERLEQLR